MYPIEEKPVPVAGMEFVRARVAGRGTYDNGNKPWVDFNAVVAGTDKTRQFVVDARGFANIAFLSGTDLTDYIAADERWLRGQFAEDGWLVN